MSRRKRQSPSTAGEDGEGWDDSVSSNFMPCSKSNIEDTETNLCLQCWHDYTISAASSKVDTAVVDKSLAMFLISKNLAVDAIETPSFVDFVKGVAKFGPKYELPSSSMLQSKSFSQVTMEVEKYVSEAKQSWAETGCTIMLGVWKNFIDAVAYSPESTVFLKLHKSPRHQKSKYDVEDIVASAIGEIGADHVVQIITNSDTIYESIENLMLDKYSQIYLTRCVAHEIHSLLKAVYDNVGWVRETIDIAAWIVKFVFQDVIVLSLMREYTSTGELKCPCISKFACNFQILQSVLSNKNDLQQLVASEEWNMIENKKVALEIASTIQNREFWSQVQEALNSMEPLIQVLRLVEDDRATIGYLYEAMEKAREAIKRRRKNSVILNLFEQSRKGKIFHPIHAAAAVLNPAYMHRVNFKMNDEMKTGIEFVLETLVSNEDKENFKKEMNLYLSKESEVFNTVGRKMLQVSHPRIWWKFAGVFLPVLRKYAMRIVSQTCKCSCDLKPSAFEAFQIEMRSGAKTTSQETFVYTSMNSKIMEKFRSKKSFEPIDLENCNELPDYVDAHQDCGWG